MGTLYIASLLVIVDSKFTHIGADFFKHVRHFNLLLQIEKSHMFQIICSNYVNLISILIPGAMKNICLTCRRLCGS